MSKLLTTLRNEIKQGCICLKISNLQFSHDSHFQVIQEKYTTPWCILLFSFFMKQVPVCFGKCSFLGLSDTPPVLSAVFSL